MTFITPEAKQLRERLHALDPSCPAAAEFLHLLSHIRRDARMLVKQAEASSKYVWADEPEYKKLKADTRQRMVAHAGRLTELWFCSRLLIDEESDDFVVRLLPPNNKGDWQGGVGVA